MDFREYNAVLLDTRIQLQQLQHLHIHAPYLQTAQSRLAAPTVMRWIGQRMERWGRRLQEHYNSEPRLAQ